MLEQQQNPVKAVTINLNGYLLKAAPKQSVLAVAIENKIDIPHFCYHEDLPIDANCRTCLVEIEAVGPKSRLKKGEIVTACTLLVEDGLQVSSQTQQVIKLRTENLELLLASHLELCPKCKQGYFCKTAEQMRTYHVTGKKYQKKRTNLPIHKMATAAELDPNLCIACNKCAEMCEEIGIGFLKLTGKGADTHISHAEDPHLDCIYCGQCTVHCPVSAAREQSQISQVEAALQDPQKMVIAQMAPAVRASIGEEFGLPVGLNVEKKMFTAFRKLGFKKVFDVNMGADITTMVEAEELVERIKTGGVLPLFTSCCPGWVKFLEFYYPEMIPHLTTARSPQIHAGGAYKTWWAEQEKIDPKQIVVVSLMPCTSKKYEAQHKKLMIDGMYPVDYVLTTREAAVLLRKHDLDLAQLEDSEADLLGQYSGAAAIYGASGGVMESALRTAAWMITGKDLLKLDFEEVRGMQGIKKAKIELAGKQLSVAVVATAKNARIILEEIKKNPRAYDYVEFMACPGGCIGGGGQPIPSTRRIIKQRIDGLYKIDQSMKMRLAHENKVVLDFLAYVKKQPKQRAHELLHTHYEAKKKYE